MTENKRFEFREVNCTGIVPKVCDNEKQLYANLFEGGIIFMVKKRFVYNIFDITGDFEEDKLKLYEIDNNPSDDLDESNLFYVYSFSEYNIKSIVDKLNSLVNENEHIKKIIQNYNANEYKHSSDALADIMDILEK